MGILKRKNPLRHYFKTNEKNLIHKWDHYFDIYHKHLKKFRRKKLVLLEFGVSHGGSLQMWKEYFGRKATIIGVDINSECKALEEKQIEIHIGSQEDRKFLKKLMEEIGEVDIVIDDGGHTMKQQKTTFDIVYDYVKNTGVYLVEDTHTSYWEEYGGGVGKNGTFVEFSKKLIDQLNAWHSQEKNKLNINEFTRRTNSMHFYDSVIVFEKGKIKEPFHQQSGKQTLSTLESWQYKSKKTPKD